MPQGVRPQPVGAPGGAEGKAEVESGRKVRAPQSPWAPGCQAKSGAGAGFRGPVLPQNQEVQLISSALGKMCLLLCTLMSWCLYLSP